MSEAVLDEPQRCPRCGGRLEAIEAGRFMGEPEWTLRCVRCGWTEGA